MSKYTTQVRWLVEQLTSDTQEATLIQRINLACPKIFDFYYPIWSEDYRLTLEGKILKHYINKEIGFETYGLWKLYLDERLNLIMPYYNQVYATTIKEYDYMTDTNVNETYTGGTWGTETGKFDQTANQTDTTSDTGNEKFTGTGTTNVQGSNNIEKKELRSDLPQANFGQIDYGTALVETTEADVNSSATTLKNDSTTDKTNTTDYTSDKTQNSTNNVESNRNENYTKVKVGAQGGKSLTELLLQYRESLLNIDQMVIEELSDLFMQIY